MIEEGLTSYSSGFLAASWFYAILAVQLTAGFPPFYFSRQKTARSGNYFEDMTKYAVKRCYLMFVSMGFVLLSADFGIVMLVLAGLPPIIFGLYLRNFVREKLGPPVSFLNAFFPSQLMHEGALYRHPMLVFDIWSVSLSALFGTVILLTSRQ